MRASASRTGVEKSAGALIKWNAKSVNLIVNLIEPKPTASEKAPLFRQTRESLDVGTRVADQLCRMKAEKCSGCSLLRLEPRMASSPP